MPLFNAKVLKVITYRSEKWSPAKTKENMLSSVTAVVRESTVEQRMLGVPLRDHIDSQTLRQMSDLKNIVVAAKKLTSGKRVFCSPCC